MNGRTLLGIALVAIGVLALADVMVDVAFLPEYIEAQFSSKENMKNRNRFGGLRVVKPLKDDHTYPGINLKTRLVSTWQLPFPWQEHSEKLLQTDPKTGKQVWAVDWEEALKRTADELYRSLPITSPAQVRYQGSALAQPTGLLHPTSS